MIKTHFVLEKPSV